MNAMTMKEVIDAIYDAGVPVRGSLDEPTCTRLNEMLGFEVCSEATPESAAAAIAEILARPASATKNGFAISCYNGPDGKRTFRVIEKGARVAGYAAMMATFSGAALRA